MDESEKPSNQEESQNEETTTTTNQERLAAASDGQSLDLLTSELESLENMVAEKLNSDETKATIESTVINPLVSLAQSAKDMVSQVEAKVETLVSDPWSYLVHKQLNGTEKPDSSLPTSDEHGGDSAAAAADSEKYTKVPEPKVHPVDNDIAANGDHEQVPRSTENQPLAGVTPQTRASWMNCCGLLEVLVRPSHQ